MGGSRRKEALTKYEWISLLRSELWRPGVALHSGAEPRRREPRYLGCSAPTFLESGTDADSAKLLDCASTLALSGSACHARIQIAGGFDDASIPMRPQRRRRARSDTPYLGILAWVGRAVLCAPPFATRTSCFTHDGAHLLLLA